VAEILVRAADSVHPDPGVDAVGCYKRGDPVVVMPDGHPWGVAELDPARFYVIRLPGVPVAALLRYLAPETHPTERGPDGRPRIVRRRRWHAQGTPETWKRELSTRGQIRRTWEEVRGYIRDKATGGTEAGRAI
jgi:hypothetical protein